MNYQVTLQIGDQPDQRFAADDELIRQMVDAPTAEVIIMTCGTGATFTQDGESETGEPLTLTVQQLLDFWTTEDTCEWCGGAGETACDQCGGSGTDLCSPGWKLAADIMEELGYAD